jgi:hypothetical protein
MTKKQIDKTTKEKPSNAFSRCYELITDNPIKTFFTALAAMFGIKTLGFWKHKSTHTKIGKSGLDARKTDTQKLKDALKKIDALLHKKPSGDAYEGDSDTPHAPLDLGSQAATALPARSEALAEMEREPSALLDHEAPAREVTITRNGGTITITLADRTTMTTTTEDFLNQNNNQALGDLILGGAEIIYIFSDGSMQQVAKAAAEEEADGDRDSAAAHVSDKPEDEDGDRDHEEGTGEGHHASAAADGSDIAGSTLSGTEL